MNALEDNQVVSIISHLTATVLFVAQKQPVVYNISTGNIYGIAHYVFLSIRNLDSTKKVQVRIRLNSDTALQETQKLMAEIFELFNGVSRAGSGSVKPVLDQQSYLNYGQRNSLMG